MYKKSGLMVTERATKDIVVMLDNLIEDNKNNLKKEDLQKLKDTIQLLKKASEKLNELLIKEGK
jgi:hypothetical protein